MTPSRFGFSCLVLLSAACSGEKAAPIIAEVTVPIARASASSAPVVVVTPLPPPIDRPKATACTLQTPRVRGKAVELRGSPELAAFATFDDGALDLDIPAVDPSSFGVATVSTAGVRVHGHVRLDDIELHAKRAFVLGEIVSPTIFSRLRITGAEDASLTVTLGTPKGLDLVATVLTAKRPCDDISLQSSSFKPEDSIAKKDKRETFSLPMDHPIDLASTAGGPILARIHASEDRDSVEVFETEGQSKRVFWPSDTEVVFGWISATELRPAKSGTGYGTGSGHFNPKPAAKRGEPLQCPMDVALIADVAAGERRTVGTVVGGTTIRVVTRSRPFSTVEVDTPGIRFAKDIALMVREDDLANCGRKPPLPQE